MFSFHSANLMINNLICSNQSSLLEAMNSINKNSLGVCFVVDAAGCLKGVLTDGDIRRALLKGVSLNGRIRSILSSDFVYGNIGESNSDLMSKIDDKVRIIPIVDNSFKVVDFFEYEHKAHIPVANPSLNGNEFKYLTDAFFSSWISSTGAYINKFEEDFSNYSDCTYGISVSNGTVALHLALVALGIGKGDEVIVPDLTFAATINAVLHTNATPVIVDIEENSWCIDPKEIEKAITPNTRAIVPVHLYGQVCDMDEIMLISKKYNLKVIEDCAEAPGASFKGKKVGSFGNIGCFSFYGNKIITTGEGGMCVTNDQEISSKMRMLRDHGMDKNKRYWHKYVGFNYRMTNIQAAIGVAQLERIDSIHINRKLFEEKYKDSLNGSLFEFQSDLKNRVRVVWLVSIRAINKETKDRYYKAFKLNGVDARSFFYPLSDMDIYKKYCKSYSLNSHKLFETGINLPTYEDINQIDKIMKVISEVH
jgi:perosamine synthetase